jgi:HAE1 family hydrophobic/amphiphilic exporter-1
MKAIIRWAVDNMPAINTLTITVLVVGALCLVGLRRETFPEFKLEMILVTVAYPGASPAEIEEGICQKIEEAVHSVSGVKKTIAVAQEGSGYLVITLHPHVRDVQRVLNEVRSKIDQIPSFPELAEKPDVTQVTFRQPAIRVAVLGPEQKGSEGDLTLRNFAERVRDDLLQLDTVSQVSLLGARNYQIDIEIPEVTLRKHGLTLQKVADLVRRENIELPGGVIKTEAQEVLLRGKSKRSLGEEIKHIPLVTQPNGVVLTVEDLGIVRDEFDDSPSMSRIDGRPAQVINVERVTEEDLLAIVDEVKTFVERYPLPPGYRLKTFHDQSIDVKERIHMLTNDGLQGLLLVFLVLAVFLELRVAFWVSTGMPIAILGAAAFLMFTGNSLNMLTMFGFMMVLGIVVDDAIVISDNIHAHRQRGATLIDAAVNGTVEVFPSIVASAGTAIIAFVPMLFVSGVMGKFVAVLPMAVIATLIISVLETTFTLPTHLAHEGNLLIGFLAWLLAPFRWLATALKRINEWTEFILDRFTERYYTPIVSRLLHLPALVIAISIAILSLTAGFVPAGITPWVLLPKMDNSALMAKIAFPDGTPFSVTDSATRKLEAAVLRVGERLGTGKSLVKLTHRHVGFVAGLGNNGPDAPTGGSHVGFVEVELLPASERELKSDEILNAWRAEVGDIAGTELLTFGVPVLGPGGAPIEFKLLAPAQKMGELEKAVEDCKAKLAEFPGVFDITDDSRPGKWEFQIQVQERAQSMGVSTADLAETVRASYYGAEVMRLQRGRHEVKLMVRYPDEQRRSLSNFEEIRVRTGDGAERPLTELAKVQVERGYAELNRVDQQRCITITADVDEARGSRGGNASEIVSELQAKFVPGLVSKYPDVHIRWEGQQEETNESVRSLLLGYGVALLGMYVVLTLEFRSYFQPFLVMIIIPFGFVGAVWGHALLGMPITLFSLFGFVALTGVMVNDSIVLIDFINSRVRQGVPLIEAVVDAGRQRLRPIFLNSTTTVIGLAPLLMDRSFQAQAIIPMAVSMAFGQMLSTTIVLLLMPTFYYTISGFSERLSRAARYAIRTGSDVQNSKLAAERASK